MIGILTQQQQFDVDPIPPEVASETIFNLSDELTAQIIPIVLWALLLIKESVQAKENVLIRCWQGVSRSSSVLIGYLMKTRKMTAKEALTFIERGRTMVS